MLTFDQAAEKRGIKNLNRRARQVGKTFDKSDRPKAFPEDRHIVEIAAHPEGEIAGYVAWWCRCNRLKGG